MRTARTLALLCLATPLWLAGTVRGDGWTVSKPESEEVDLPELTPRRTPAPVGAPPPSSARASPKGAFGDLPPFLRNELKRRGILPPDIDDYRQEARRRLEADPRADALFDEIAKLYAVEQRVGACLHVRQMRRVVERESGPQTSLFNQLVVARFKNPMLAAQGLGMEVMSRGFRCERYDPKRGLSPRGQR